jgi:hemolysin-activating ACP:hemolysin acyltransferase
MSVPASTLTTSATGVVETEGPARKKTCIRAVPDVTIVVGGVEFKEFGQVLCLWSSYFDTALSSGLRETETKRFEFPDRDPKEWEWIASLMAPMSKERVTVEKLDVALSWFDELCCNGGLEECDKVLFRVLRGKTRRDPVQEDIDYYITSMDTSFKYRLNMSKKKCFAIVRHVLLHHNELITEDTLKRILSTMKDNIDCKNNLLPIFRDILPTPMSAEQLKILFESGVLHHFTWSQISHQKKSKYLEQRVNRLAEKLLAVVSKVNNRSGLRDLILIELSADTVIGDLMPFHE